MRALVALACACFAARADEPAPKPALTIEAPAALRAIEEEPLTTTIRARAADGAEARVLVTGLPPGARYTEAEHTLSFTPDFTQGGARFVLEVEARGAGALARKQIELVVDDTIKPPTPIVVQAAPSEDGAGLVQRIDQTTDAFLDAPAFAGRVLHARVVVPMSLPEGRAPVRVVLHGFDDNFDFGRARDDEITIFPDDPGPTYWWGYADDCGDVVDRRKVTEPPMREAQKGPVRRYTVRRILHLLDFVLRTMPRADPTRVVVSGRSMGGAGALAIGLLHARHFALVEAQVAATIPRLHRPMRIRQLARIWGKPTSAFVDVVEGDDEAALSPWDRLDVTRVLRDVAPAREQLLVVRHAKDDFVIHFPFAVKKSPTTTLSFYEALQKLHVGHLATWDEASHFAPDPVVGPDAWKDGVDLVHGSSMRAQVGVPFIAFGHSSLDDDPGTGGPRPGKRADADRGLAGDPSIEGDTGYDGQNHGGINHRLRFDGARVVDTWDRFEVPLFVEPLQVDDAGAKGLAAKLPATVDATPRRVQRFRLRKDEAVCARFGPRTVDVVADADGAVTVAGLALEAKPRTLALTRGACPPAPKP